MILCSAQTTAEWLRQKKTRISYLLQQIAAQQVYLNDLKKGYGIVSGGLQVISDVKHGDFDLYRNYFSSLSDVSGSVKEAGKTKCITDMQAQILRVNRTIRAVLSSAFLHPSETKYINATLDGLLKQCNEDIDKLSILITPGRSIMTDAQRLNGLDDLYEAA